MTQSIRGLVDVGLVPSLGGLGTGLGRYGIVQTGRSCPDRLLAAGDRVTGLAVVLDRRDL